MVEFNHLIRTGENDFVRSRNISSADRADPDFLRISLFHALRTVIGKMICAVHPFIDALRQRQGSSAWRILLLVMMALYDLNVKSFRRKLLRCFLHQLQQQIDAKGHIGGPKQRNLLRIFLYPANLLIRQSCRADHDRNLLPDCIVHHRIKYFGRAEIHNHVSLFSNLIKASVHRVSTRARPRNVNPGNNLHLRIRCGKLRDHLSHPAIAAGQQYLCHIPFPHSHIQRIP